jgi:MSHA biogenesis protein MshJ
MSPAIRRLAERIDAMTLRERVLIFFAVAALVVTTLDALLIEPSFAAAKRTSLEIARQQAEIAGMDKQLQALATSTRTDPDREKRARLESLRRELGELESRIASEQGKVTGPEQMRSLVENLIARNPKVSLVELRTVPKESLVQRTAEVLAPELVHRHSLEVTVSGGYLDLLAYLADLERLPHRIRWTALALDASAHPRILLKFTLQTRSLDSAWMNV